LTASPSARGVSDATLFTPGRMSFGVLERSFVATESVDSGLAFAVLVDDDPTRVATLPVVVVLAALAATLQIDG
jgi:hypothetical protein